MENIGKTDAGQNCIDRIDVKTEQKELLDLYYRLQLLHLVKVLLYQGPEQD